MVSFRKLPIDAHEKLLMLSDLLQETIADLRPGWDWATTSHQRR
jgi:hypothetical protein